MPIVEPEVLCDGDHDLRTAQKVTERVGILLTIRALTHSVLAVDFVSVFFRRVFFVVMFFDFEISLCFVVAICDLLHDIKTIFHLH